MATPVRRTRPLYRRRSFDLRATALFFGLLAIVLIVLGYAARTLAEVVERRPALAVVLALVAVPTAVLLLRGRRRFSAGRAARRAAAALDEATQKAVHALDEAAEPARPAAYVPGPAVAEPVAAGAPEATRRLVPDDLLTERIPAGVDAVTEYTVVEDVPVGYESVDYDALDGDEFEQAVAALCERDGCAGVEVVGGAGDLGADVVATTPDGRRLVVQCKRYCDTNKVGSQDLQRFGGTCFTVHEADVAVLVTTSDFTAPAAEYAEQCGILCFDRQALCAWSDGTGPAPWALPGPGGAAGSLIG